MREAGLLLSLISVMAVTAYYTMLGTVNSPRPESAAIEEDRSESNVPARVSIASPPRVVSTFPPPRLPISPAPLPPPSAEALVDPSPPEFKPDPPFPPVQEPDDSPRQPIRLADPAATDISSIDDLPILRLPVDLSGTAPTFSPLPSRAPAPPEPGGTTEAPRLLVGDSSGRVLVSRLYARGPAGPIVQLPDGSLGWPEGEVATDRPFQPWTAREVSRSLLNGRYRGFRAIERPPYLMLTEGSDEFAERAADLLKTLHDDLTTCLEEGGIPVSEPEFPLVAIIHRDEASFRRNRDVDPDVQAYYEVASNRIVLCETSEQDRRAPELAALTRPQTIAHEGVHQILQNVGVQPRLASWPSWLVEGLAEYYAPMALPESGKNGWGDFGRSNFGRVNPLHMATLIDLQDPSTLLAHLRGPGPGPSSPSWARLGPDEPWVTHLMLRTELSPTDYALSWCLTHYLAQRHPETFRAYLRSLGRRPPLESRTAEQHLRDFSTALAAPPSSLTRRIDRHLSSLRYERVPYYAVRFEQRMTPGFTRRGILVSPSPTMITQWLDAQTLPDGGPLLWWATPFDSRNRARLSCESWLLQPFP